MKKINLIKEFSARRYQQTIFANCIDKNSLVILPTGLGKTVIALMLSIYYFNKTGKKVLFLAPTKPLVEQQKKSFEEFIINNSEFNFQVLTGLISPTKRVDMYKENDFIFSTPQLIENDIINGILDLNDFSFIIFDEAHRGVGGYAYTFISEEFTKKNVKSLALTASPGTSISEIQTVIKNLNIEHIEVRKYDDLDVKDYVNKTEVKRIEVELPKEFEEIKKELNQVYLTWLQKLQALDFLKGKRPSMVTKKDLLDLQRELRVLISSGDGDEIIWSGISLSAGLMKLMHGIELFESQELSAAHSYFYNFFREGGDKSKAAEELSRNIDFRSAFENISKLKEKGILHPKLIEVKKIISSEISKNKDLRIILFSQYRESAQIIVKELEKIKEIKPTIFVGQAKKGDVKMSQKEQKKILDEFRSGEYNVIVSTSVGEEGLDIPKVDLVMFYEPVASAIRTIQRIGRTGRFDKGNAFIMQTKGTRDIVTSFIASAKEKRMYKSLEKIEKDFQESSKVKSRGLNKFLKEDNSSSKKISVENDYRYLVYIDNRENNDLIKELYKFDNVKVESKKLEVGDIILSEDLAIERKAKKDFVNSIIDKRLFPQLLDLAKNYRRPVLIIEGEENLFSIRNLNPNVIRSTLSAIAVDLRMPIIYTNSLHETAQMILTMVKRNQRDKKEISLVAEKKSFSENEELEKFISSIPKINVINAKALLNHFNSVKDLVNASEKDLIECKGIGKGRAQFLVNFFKREYKNL